MKVLWFTSAPDSAGLTASERLLGCSIHLVRSASDALAALQSASFHGVVADFPAEHTGPGDWLHSVRAINADLPVVIWVRTGSIRDERLRSQDAVRVFTGPVTEQRLIDALSALVQLARADASSQGGSRSWRHLLVGESRAIDIVAETIDLVAPRRCTVLITGETGTGKEVVARAIHMASPRSTFPMIPVNCTALPEALLESELFGHVRGAFTGAVTSRPGRFEQAHRGTLFLDEIGDLPLQLQPKLLRFLQDREVQRIGGTDSSRVDVRVVAATNADLLAGIEKGSFRQDLFYRLNVVPIHVPPLRARLDDIPVLLDSFIEKVCRQEDLPPKWAVPETYEHLQGYAWPGNVRQLENAVEMAIILSGSRCTLFPKDFHLAQAPAQALAPPAPLHVLSADGALDYQNTLNAIELTLLDQALRLTGGNKTRAADMLGLKRTTLTAKLRMLKRPPVAGDALVEDPISAVASVR
jgi:DNA-binding NtrC family response regulator